MKAMIAAVSGDSRVLQGRHANLDWSGQEEGVAIRYACTDVLNILQIRNLLIFIQICPGMPP